jgi:hypothetical protein
MISPKRLTCASDAILLFMLGETTVYNLGFAQAPSLT